jgi:two-component system chemotaxis sensor kinase CheA
LPLIFLNRQLGLPENAAAEQGDAVNIVVLQADEHQFGLVVDTISDTEEIVVKPLGAQLKGIACFAGATIMGDGHVALILDVLGLAQKANVVTEAREQAVNQSPVVKADDEHTRQSWLLFRSPGGARLAVPLSAVDRLEEFPAEKVERSGSGEVVQYRGEIMPLIRISSLLNETAASREVLPVVVFRKAQNSFGLVVDRIDDITEDVAVFPSDGRGDLVAGSAVIEHRVTDLLDLKCVMALAGERAATQAVGRA